MTVHAIVQQCFELFQSKISKTFWGFAPWTTPGRAYSTPYNQLHNGFSPHYAYQKTGTSHTPPPQKKKKIAGYGTDILPGLQIKFAPSVTFTLPKNDLLES